MCFYDLLSKIAQLAFPKRFFQTSVIRFFSFEGDSLWQFINNLIQVLFCMGIVDDFIVN